MNVAKSSFVVGLFGLAVLVRLAVGGALLSGGPESFVLASDDGDAYDAAARWQAFGEPIVMTERMAQKWAVDTTVASRWPQGYWLFLAGQYHLFGLPYSSTVVLQALIGGGGVLAVYALARRVLPRAGARLAGVALALSSTGIVLSAALYAESLFIPLLGGGLAMLAAATRSGLPRRSIWMGLALSGAIFGLAQVSRPLALPVFVVAAAWWLLGCGPRPAAHGRVVGLGVFGAAFLLSLAPFVAHDLLSNGRVTTFTVGGAEAFRDLALSGATTSLGDRFGMLFLSGWGPLGEPLISLVGPASVGLRLGEWLLAALGAGWLLSSPERRPVGVLLVLAAVVIIGPALVLGLPLVRYRASADPLLIVTIVAGLVALKNLTVRDRSRA